MLQLQYMSPRTAKFIFLGALFFLPLFVFAQGAGLVPCGVSSNFLEATGCNFCYLAQLVQRVVNFLIMVAIPISVAMFAWAGIMFFTSTGNPKKIAHAKSIFSSVFIGFLIAISGWLVVQVVLQTITNQEFYKLNNWTNLECKNYNSEQQRPRNQSIGNVLSGNGLVSTAPAPGAGGSGGVAGAPSTGETYNDSEARTQLQLAGLTVNKLDCASAGQTNCTSLGGIHKTTITQTVNLMEACGCSFVVTGGTEAGHAPGPNSHGSGHKIDISLGAVDSYIQNSMTQIGNRTSDNAPQWRDQYGNIYAKESNHWDILVKAAGPLPSPPSPSS